MSEEGVIFRRLLAEKGLSAALLYLNSRTPHRFTGVYRYDGEMLRSLALVDRQDSRIAAGKDVRLADAYCDYLGDDVDSMEFCDARSDGRIAAKLGSLVVSYCGVLIRAADGRPFGTLCHYDMRPCQPRTSDVPLLREVAVQIYNHVTGKSPAR